MKLIKPMLLSGLCTSVCLLSQPLLANDSKESAFGIKWVDAKNVVFDQSHLCPYPVQFQVRIFNDLKIAGLKKFSYRWVVNGDVHIDNGRFVANPSDYGSGYDIQTTIIRVGNDDETNVGSAWSKMINVIGNREKIYPNAGWYQFLALPEGETNWYDAVKSNKATYKINCKTSDDEVMTDTSEVVLEEKVSLPTAETLTTTVDDKITIHASMLFKFDSDELSDDAKAVLDERIQKYKGKGELTRNVMVVGHTDTVGEQNYNQNLSERRAKAVAQYLEQNTLILDEQIDAIGKGSSEPIADNNTKEGRAQNRRVEIIVQGKLNQ